MRNTDCGMRSVARKAIVNRLPLTDYAPGRSRNGCSLKITVAISGSGNCRTKHRMSLSPEIGPERLIHTGPKTQLPWRCLTKQCAQGDGKGWRLRLSVCHTNRFVQLFWPKTLTADVGQSPLPKTPALDKGRASAVPAQSTSSRYLFRPVTGHSRLLPC
jgi:hypothetical protein